MEEAVEICKLRLFLKLVAQVDKTKDLEPLPDVDFNIRAGNTLVGFVSREEIRLASEKEISGQGKLVFGQTEKALQRIEEEAEIVDRAYQKFHEMQTEYGMDACEFSDQKQVLRENLNTLKGELDQYLAREYGVHPEKSTEFYKWRTSHQPFHWFAEFYGIMTHEGFNVVIGNPPYVEYGKVKKQYQIMGYQTENCGNLYGYVLERTFALMQGNGGRIGLIVPISIASSERMLPLRTQTLFFCRNIWLSNFAIRPQPLFPEIVQRNSIVIGRLSKEATYQLYSSHYLRWTAVERPYLLTRLSFREVSEILGGNKIVPKVDTQTGIHILKKMNGLSKHIGQLANGRPGVLYFHDSGESYWTKTLWEKPVAYRNGDRVEPAQWFSVRIPVDERPFIYLLLNSNLLYWLWTVFTDCRHMTKGFIESISLPENRGIDDTLVGKLKAAYSQNTTLFEKRPGYKSPEIKVQNFKPLIDEIDRALAKHYGFTDEELDFIINYDIKYRMGTSDSEDENGA
ncbi:MAG: hypothetical protein FJ110_18965 [Deltaproteobacteria bacterium]|nr:hypothetical protein [Deltaproteobacteria bacterium]